jgi:hypothetical protein
MDPTMKERRVFSVGSRVWLTTASCKDGSATVVQYKGLDAVIQLDLARQGATTSVMS